MDTSSPAEVVDDYLACLVSPRALAAQGNTSMCEVVTYLCHFPLGLANLCYALLPPIFNRLLGHQEKSIAFVYFPHCGAV